MTGQPQAPRVSMTRISHPNPRVRSTGPRGRRRPRGRVLCDRGRGPALAGRGRRRGGDPGPAQDGPSGGPFQASYPRAGRLGAGPRRDAWPVRRSGSGLDPGTQHHGHPRAQAHRRRDRFAGSGHHQVGSPRAGHAVTTAARPAHRRSGCPRHRCPRIWRHWPAGCACRTCAGAPRRSSPPRRRSAGIPSRSSKPSSSRKPPGGNVPRWPPGGPPPGSPPAKRSTPGTRPRSLIPAPTQAALRTLEWVGRRENLVVCGPSGTGKTFFLEALGFECVTRGLKVAWFTLEDLGNLIRRHRADDTMSKAIADPRSDPGCR